MAEPITRRNPHRHVGETNQDALARLAGERDAARSDADRLRALLPPAGLPAVLATVDDVARVAAAAGLTEDDTPTESDPRMRSWDDGLLDATDRGGTLWLKVRGSGTSWRSVTYYRQPVGIVWSAIQAARGGAS